uniref:Transglutaminase-like domain-containing protein n=1 Tax=Eubacterium plexicaudatum ASF492 TaxID=1235802 RepID=N1ZYG5_9FIRM
MKNFAKAAKSMLIFCFTFMMIGCIWSVHQAEAKTKTIQKGVTYDTDLEEVFMDISKLTPEEGKKTLDRLSTGKYGDKLLVAVVKATSVSGAEKKYKTWGEAFQKLSSNKYRLLPFSGMVKTEKWKKGYYECYDSTLAPVNNYYYLERYIDNIFAFQEGQENIFGSKPINYFENFTFTYTNPAGQKQTGQLYMDYMNFSIKSVYSDILSKEQFAEASDAVKTAFLLFPRVHFTTYKIGTSASDCDMKALAEKRWKGVCSDFCVLTHRLTTFLSFDIHCEEIGLTSLYHAVSFVRAKNSDGKWEYFRTDNDEIAFDVKSGVRYRELDELSKSYPFLTDAYAYMSSSPMPELTKKSLEYNIKKGFSKGCLDSTIETTVSMAYQDGHFRRNDTITYTFTNENDETYGHPEYTGTYPSK